MKNKNNKGVNVLEIIFAISCMVLVGIIIYFLLNNMSTKEIVTNVRVDNTLDQVNSIMSATDNAINKIYNVLVVSTIFFTVLVAAVSMFQFIKIKDVDRLKMELSYELKKLRKKVNNKINNSEIKLNQWEKDYTNKISRIEVDFNKQSEKINILVDELNDKITKLNQKAIELEIDTNFVKAKELEKREICPLAELRKYYKRIIELLRKNPEIKPSQFVFDSYINLASVLLKYGPCEGNIYEEIKAYLDEAISIATRNEFIEYEIVPAYRLFVELERIYHEDGGNDIFYLEKIYEENVYHIDCAIEYANALDKRNLEDDIEIEMDVLKSIVKNGGVEAKQKVFAYKNSGYFINLSKSSFNIDLDIIIDLYRDIT